MTKIPFSLQNLLIPNQTHIHAIKHINKIIITKIGWLHHLVRFVGLGGFSKNVLLALNIIWVSVVWVIWKARNWKKIQLKDEHLQSLSGKIKFQSFW